MGKMKIVIKPIQPVFQVTNIGSEVVFLVNEELNQDLSLKRGDRIAVGQATGEIVSEYSRWKLLFARKLEIVIS